jgi:alpha-tubulin suppressor-like RCC1 family protein
MFRSAGSSQRLTRLFRVALVAAVVAAGVVPASASEASGAAAWGENNDGQLGNGTTTTEKEAVAVKIISEATTVAGGELHGLALLKDGKVMAWGDNVDGQLGNGTTTTEKEPVEVKGLSEVVAVAAGADHSLALLKSGKVMAWGDNADGQLGNGATTTEKEPVEVKGLSEVVAIAAGADHSLAVLKSGKVKAWGDNNDGQLGNGTTTTEKEPVEVKGLTEPAAVAGGEFHSLALLKNGKVMAWGENNDGQLGNGTTTTEKEPVEVKGLTEAVAIAAGHSHSLAVLKSGKVKAWGENNDGQLGNGTTTTEKEPVEVKGLTEATAVAGGQFHSLALLKNGKVMAWGDNEDGQLGNNTTTTEKEPVEVKGLAGAAGWVAAGAAFSLAAYAIAPGNTVLPAISGKAEERQTLTASTGTWTGTEPITYTYQWQTCNSKGESCTNISGATSSTYKLTASAVGDTIRVEVTAKNVVKSTSAFSAVTSVVAASLPENTTLPAISGTAESGQSLTVSNGSWEGTSPISYTYQWESCNSKGEGCTNITGATASSYRVVNSQVGDTLREVVMASNSAGNAKATSAATGTVTPGPPVEIVLPVISGNAEEGRVLSASTGEWAGGEPFTYTYQWQSCNAKGESCTNISGATKSTLGVTASYVGKTLRIVVTAKNSIGTSEATSAASAVVLVPEPPVNTALPTVSGGARDGQTLVASTGTWSGRAPISYAYQWQSCNWVAEECHAIEGAAGSSYVLGQGQEGDTVSVIVTATNASGTAQASSAATAVVEQGAPSEVETPSVSGVAAVGQTLKASSGQWSGSEVQVSYQWEQCNSSGVECSPIAGATNNEYTAAESDLGRTLRVLIGASNSLGAVTALSPATPAVVESSLANTVAPTVWGTAQNGKTLTVSSGSWVGNAEISYSYQWQRCNLYGLGCKAIEGATSTSYTLGSADVGSTIRAVVTAANTVDRSASLTSTTSNPVAASSAPVTEVSPVVAGPGLVGETLTASPGAWSGEGSVTYTYQWQRCNAYGEACAAISGATAATYTTVEADAGSTDGVIVKATASGKSTEAAATPIAVAASALANVAAPSASGVPVYGFTLTANPGTWTGSGTITYAYQWQRCNEKGEECANIAGATATTYTLAESDVGHRLKVLVEATSPSGKSSLSSSATEAIFPEAYAPRNVLPPWIEGTANERQVLSANPGTWLATEPATYTYHWQRCNTSGEECTDIEGATNSTYTLAKADDGSTIRVIVTDTNEIFNASATSPQTETVLTPGPPANTEAPQIQGTAQQGQRLFASNGAWSGSRPLTFFYGWERCNSTGEECTAIEGATKPSYTLQSADVGSTLRLKITASNSLVNAAVFSAITAVVRSSSEASTSPAIELAQSTDPSVIAKATSATLEEETVKPALIDTAEALSSEATLTSSSVSKETPGEFSVGISSGEELSLAPIGTAPNATSTPTIVNGTAAVFAGTSTQTDTIVRPEPLGATTMLQLHSSQAPSSFSWEVRLGAEQELQKLANGSVAVVEKESGSYLEGELSSEILEGTGKEASAETSEHGYGSESANEEFGGSLEETTSQLEHLPSAATSSTTPVAPKESELHPQETPSQYENGSSAMSYAESHASGKTLMVIEAPTIMDAAGHTIPASLSVEGNTLTMTYTPSKETTFPATAAIAVTGSSAKKASPSPEAHRGLSDELKSAFDESEKEGKLVKEYDPRLKSHMKIESARLIINFNTSPHSELLNEWLKAVVHEAQIKPEKILVTFRECEPEPPNYKPGEKALPCPSGPSVTSPSFSGYYYNHVYELMKELIKDGVRTFGAWNEPNKFNAPLHPDAEAGRAALLWGEAQHAVERLGCTKHCVVVAGEFTGYFPIYTGKYVGAILKDAKRGDPTRTKPTVWGLHDYNDLEKVQAEQQPGGKEVIAHSYTNSEADSFVRLIKSKRLGSTHIWLTEQGVKVETAGGGTGSTRLTGHPELQRLAAQDFIRLGSPSMHIERLYYYQYRGPSKERKEELAAKEQHEFDSALLAGEGYGPEPKNWRPAFCVLVLGDNGCPASSVTKTAVTGAITETTATVAADINPEGLPTKYQFEYGTSEAYEHTTSAAAVPNPEGTQSATMTLTHLQPCTVYHYEAEAENEGNEGKPGLGGDEEFETECKGSARIRFTFLHEEDSGRTGFQSWEEELDARTGALVFDPAAGCSERAFEFEGCIELEVKSMSREIPEAFRETAGTVVSSRAAEVLGAKMLSGLRVFRIGFDVNWKAVNEEYPLKSGRAIVQDPYEFEIDWNAKR